MCSGASSPFLQSGLSQKETRLPIVSFSFTCFLWGWGALRHVLPLPTFSLPSVGSALAGLLHSQAGPPGPQYCSMVRVRSSVSEIPQALQNSAMTSLWPYPRKTSTGTSMERNSHQPSLKDFRKFPIGPPFPSLLGSP